MLGLCRRTHAGRGRLSHRIVLRVEGLESRDQPSDPGLNTGLAGGIQSPANQPPEILDFECREIDNGLFVITGRVVDESPGGLRVTLGGSTSAAGQSAITASDGTFRLVVQLRVNGTDAGYITATVVDAQGLVSEEVEEFVEPTPP